LVIILSQIFHLLGNNFHNIYVKVQRLNYTVKKKTILMIKIRGHIVPNGISIRHLSFGLHNRAEKMVELALINNHQLTPFD